MNTWYEWMKRMLSRNTSYPSWQGFNCRGVWEFAHMRDWEVTVNWNVTKESEGRTMGSETVLREEEPQHPSNGSNTVSEIMVCDRAHNINLNQPQCPGCSDKSGMQENKRCRGKGTCQEDGLKSPRKGDFFARLNWQTIIYLCQRTLFSDMPVQVPDWWPRDCGVLGGELLPLLTICRVCVDLQRGWGLNWTAY